MSSDRDEKRQTAVKPPSTSTVWLPPTPESLFTPLSTTTPASRVPFEPLPPAALSHSHVALRPTSLAVNQAHRGGPGPAQSLPLVRDPEELAHCRLPPILSMLSDKVPAPHVASRFQETRLPTAAITCKQPNGDGRIVIDDDALGRGTGSSPPSTAQGSRKRQRGGSSGSSEDAVDKLGRLGSPRSLLDHDGRVRGEDLELKMSRETVDEDDEEDLAEPKGKRVATGPTSSSLPSPPTRHNLRVRRNTKPTSVALSPVLQEDGVDSDEVDQVEDDDDEDYSVGVTPTKWKSTASQASSSTGGGGGGGGGSGAGAGAAGRERERAPGRRISHSLIERRRRERINECLQKLRNIVPQCSAMAELKRQKSRRRNRPSASSAAAGGGEDGAGGGGGNMHKLEILLGTIEYVEELRARVEELEREREKGANGVGTSGQGVGDKVQAGDSPHTPWLAEGGPAAAASAGLPPAATQAPMNSPASLGLGDRLDEAQDPDGDGGRSPSTDATEDDAAVLLLALASPDLRPVVT
jgi:hypothetical protein